MTYECVYVDKLWIEKKAGKAHKLGKMMSATGKSMNILLPKY